MPVYGNARRRHVGLGSLIDRAVASDASNGASRTSRIVSTQGVPRQVPFLHKPVAGSNQGHATDDPIIRRCRFDQLCRL